MENQYAMVACQISTTLGRISHRYNCSVERALYQYAAAAKPV